jgi:hypothetical protein
MAVPLIQHQTELSGALVLFCRFLRGKGFALSPMEEADALKALAALPINGERFFKGGLKAILAKNQHQQAHFDAYYNEFWAQYTKATEAKIKQHKAQKEKLPETRKQAAQFESLKNWLNLSVSEEEKQVPSYSDIELLSKKNFVDLSEAEMLLMMRLLEQMARKIAHQKSRLRKVSKKQSTIDLKRTIGFNLRKGGEIQHWLFSERKDRKLKLVLLCDVSRSMELYSRFFVHLIYAFQNAYDKIETFVFSTALHRVTEILEHNKFEKAFDIISDRVPNWSGGTTIGDCLLTFTKDFGYRMLDKNTIVFVLSDGWDTGKPHLIGESMGIIYKRSKKVIWLNPLSGSANFSPEAIGLKTALPFIDVLAPAHNMESLKQALMLVRKRRNLFQRKH